MDYVILFVIIGVLSVSCIDVGPIIDTINELQSQLNDRCEYVRDLENELAAQSQVSLSHSW